MILINNEVLLSNKMELNEFILALEGEIYNNESEQVVHCIINYLTELWDRDEKLMIMMHKHITDTFYPVIIVDIEETADLTCLEVQVHCTDEDYVISKKDKKAFEEFCEKYFRSMRPLYYRFCDLDIE